MFVESVHIASSSLQVHKPMGFGRTRKLKSEENEQLKQQPIRIGVSNDSPVFAFASEIFYLLSSQYHVPKRRFDKYTVSFSAQ